MTRILRIILLVAILHLVSALSFGQTFDFFDCTDIADECINFTSEGDFPECNRSPNKSITVGPPQLTAFGTTATGTSNGAVGKVENSTGIVQEGPGTATVAVTVIPCHGGGIITHESFPVTVKAAVTRAIWVSDSCKKSYSQCSGNPGCWFPQTPINNDNQAFSSACNGGETPDYHPWAVFQCGGKILSDGSVAS